LKLASLDGGTLYEAELRRENSSKSLMLLIPLAILLLLIIHYAATGNPMVGGLFIGIVVGMILQRARFCFATAFRDLFNGPENNRSLDIHKGIVIAIAVGSTGVFALKYMNMVDAKILVSPVSIANVAGGAIFTFGSILAGGCASGVLWRAGEGHARAWLAITSTVLTYPLFVAIITRPYLSGYPRIFLPYALGWAQAFIAMTVFLLLYLLSIYLEYRYRAQS